ncbi:hypothetical protein F4604DRAFT_1676967 [Suillus subluteus]|nr:hypothetical protein F4604DRAFT_1676967 [Suillus subluteus]
MITGDNSLTAVHISQDVEIVDRDALILDLCENPAHESAFDQCLFDDYNWEQRGGALMVPRDLYDKTGSPSSASLVEPGSNANWTSRTRSVTFGPGFDQMVEPNLWFGLAFGKFAPRTGLNRTSAALMGTNRPW